MSEKYNLMKGINNYDRKLSNKNKNVQTLRGKVGGLWEELGRLQLDFMIEMGLKPRDKMLDIGCGCLRGGIKFINYLETNNYYGIDINESLLKAGHHEIELANLTNKKAALLLDSEFNFDSFKQKFDYMISVSVFTHLPLNMILRCLVNVRKNLSVNGKYFSTIFLSNNPLVLDPIIHQPHGIKTYFDQDPFHYSIDEIKMLAKLANLKVKLIGNWKHPRAQQMLMFYI